MFRAFHSQSTNVVAVKQPAGDPNRNRGSGNDGGSSHAKAQMPKPTERSAAPVEFVFPPAMNFEQFVAATTKTMSNEQRRLNSDDNNECPSTSVLQQRPQQSVTAGTNISEANHTISSLAPSSQAAAIVADTAGTHNEQREAISDDGGLDVAVESDGSVGGKQKEDEAERHNGARSELPSRFFVTSSDRMAAHREVTHRRANPPATFGVEPPKHHPLPPTATASPPNENGSELNEQHEDPRCSNNESNFVAGSVEHHHLSQHQQQRETPKSRRGTSRLDAVVAGMKQRARFTAGFSISIRMQVKDIDDAMVAVAASASAGFSSKEQGDNKGVAFSARSLQEQKNILIQQLLEFFRRGIVKLNFSGARKNILAQRARRTSNEQQHQQRESSQENDQCKMMNEKEESGKNIGSPSGMQPKILRRGAGIARIKQMGAERRGVMTTATPTTTTTPHNSAAAIPETATAAAAATETAARTPSQRQKPHSGSAAQSASAVHSRHPPRALRGGGCEESHESAEKFSAGHDSQQQQQQQQQQQKQHDRASPLIGGRGRERHQEVAARPPSWALPRGASRHSTETIRSFAEAHSTLPQLLDQLFPAELEEETLIPRIPCNSQFFASHPNGSCGGNDSVAFTAAAYHAIVQAVQRRRNSL